MSYKPFKNCDAVKDIIRMLNQGEEIDWISLSYLRQHLLRCEKCFNRLNEKALKEIRG